MTPLLSPLVLAVAFWLQGPTDSQPAQTREQVEAKLRSRLVKGTELVRLELTKEHKYPALDVGDLADVVAEYEQPIRTSLTIKGVQVMAVELSPRDDKSGEVGAWKVWFQVTPTQAKALSLIQKDGCTLSVRRNTK